MSDDEFQKWETLSLKARSLREKLEAIDAEMCELVGVDPEQASVLRIGVYREVWGHFPVLELKDERLRTTN